MRGRLEDIRRLDAELLVVDPHEAWGAKFLLKQSGTQPEDVGFPLLTDPALTVSAAYGVAFQMRIHTEVSNRPATFLIDRGGVLRYARRARNFGDRPTPDEIVTELRKLN